MKTLLNIVNEKLILNKSTSKGNEYNCHPKDRTELRKIIEERLKEDNDADLNDIDVSQITDMTELFYKLDPHNIDISEWDVSNVTNMSCMFAGCENFNSDLSSWNVRNIEDMYRMFNRCRKFDADLSSWDVSNAENMMCMFDGCESLKNKPSWYWYK